MSRLFPELIKICLIYGNISMYHRVVTVKLLMFVDVAISFL